MVSKNLYKRIENKFNLLGYTINPLVFIYMRLISSIILFILLLFVPYGYIVSPIVTFIYYFAIEYFVLNCSIKLRKSELEYDALEYFPIFLLSLNGERNIRKALVLSCNSVDNSLSNEFKRVLYDEKIGKSLDESLMLLKSRIPSEFITNIIVSIIEANRMGNSISDSVNIQLKYIEDKKNKRVLAYYKGIPLKMAIISMLFVFAILCLMILCNV
jgi:tight adherence protein C